MVHVTLIRSMKAPQVVSVDGAKTVEGILQAGGFNAEQYANWSIKDQSTGYVLGLSDTVNDSTTLIVGQEVAGA